MDTEERKEKGLVGEVWSGFLDDLLGPRRELRT